MGWTDRRGRRPAGRARWTSPFHGFSRTTTTTTTAAAVEIGGMTIPEDATVRLCFASANRDPNVYERPDVFDTDRSVNRHLGFGHGPHACVGAALARLEMRTACKELLHRFPDIHLVDTNLELDLIGGILAVPRTCRVEFTP